MLLTINATKFFPFSSLLSSQSGEITLLPAVGMRLFFIEVSKLR